MTKNCEYMAKTAKNGKKGVRVVTAGYLCRGVLVVKISISQYTIFILVYE